MSVLASSASSDSGPSSGSDDAWPRRERAPLLAPGLGVAVQRQVDAGPLAHQLHQFGLRAHGDHLALVHDADPVGELLGLFHVVGGVEDGHAARR